MVRKRLSITYTIHTLVA
ncbi:hypothetical protein E2C01_032290 [Portunus trituberculatus]|uniref:Uncharacterized protein n=1 Tax=Portunus trituberculatus TaxID=210409 RepID=A0A5B7F0D0_PORTR|nr:hypothetical protein [Portunus trituberculatus]